MSSASNDDSQVERRDWRFRVRVVNLKKHETVCVTGEGEELGNWSPKSVVPLIREGQSEIWSTFVRLPSKHDIFYRYCTCYFNDPLKQVDVRTWETNISPRVVKQVCTNSAEDYDTFGSYDGKESIDKGWLNSQTLLQFHFSRNPFTLKMNADKETISIKLTPVQFQLVSDCGETLNEEGKNSGDNEESFVALTEVATLNKKDSNFKQQDKLGCDYQNGDFVIFNVTSSDHSALAYVFDFYKHNNSGDGPVHIGHSHVFPNCLQHSEGHLQLPIVCLTKHRPLGMVKVGYLVVRPMAQPLCNTKVSYTKHWRSTWKGLDVGHRGSGASFKAMEGVTIRENTIASLKSAAENGADLIEFDVQLSKDLVPVLYHDFHVSIALKQKNSSEHTEMLEIPMKDLTLEQLQKLKVFNLTEGKNNKPMFYDEHLADHQPFPLLSEVLQAVDQHVGFNIEIKWNMMREDGSLELQHPFDLNLYIDKILDVVLSASTSRHIVFSCFHPDVCTVLRLKQNIYPVMFLTQGVTDKWPSYHDPRCTSIMAAAHHALNADLLGVVVHTEDLLRDPTQIQDVINAGLIIFCWGEDNNNTETIRHLKSLGLHAVIYDKLEQYNTKEVKESIFYMEAKEAEKAINQAGKETSETCS